MGEDTRTVEERLDEVENQLFFIMQACQMKMVIPSKTLNAQGQAMGKEINGNILAFYLKAKANGKHRLDELTAEDFQDERVTGSGIIAGI